MPPTIPVQSHLPQPAGGGGGSGGVRKSGSAPPPPPTTGLTSPPAGGQPFPLACRRRVQNVFHCPMLQRQRQPLRPPTKGYSQRHKPRSLSPSLDPTGGAPPPTHPRTRRNPL